jgi:uncharacterized protein involved in exopolysaccharide biosynthesis
MDASIDLKQYVRMFWRRKGIIVLCAVTVVCAAKISLEFIPDQYEAEATLMIEERQRLASPIEDIMGGMRQPSRGYKVEEKRMAELAGRVRSRPFLERLVRLLQMQNDPDIQAYAENAHREHPQLSIDEMAIRSVINGIRKKVRFERAGSDIYKIIVADTDPRSAQLLAKWVSELYVDTSLQNTLDQLRSAHEFGAEQMRIYEEQLQQRERALAQYRQSKIEQSLDRSSVRAGNIAVADALYKRLIDETELARVRRLPLERTVSASGMKGEEAAVVADPEVRRQTNAVTSSLKDNITDRLVDDTPSVGEWPPAGAYATMRRGLYSAIERRVDRSYGGVEAEARDSLVRLVFSSLDQEIYGDAGEFLGRAIADFRRQAQAEPTGELEEDRLVSEVSKARDLLQTFQAQLVASDVSQAMEATNLGLRIEILESPVFPIWPSSPDRKKMLMTAMLIGPLLGLGFALLSELTDNTLRSVADFERVYHGAILGITPLVERTKPDLGRIRRYWVPAAVATVMMLTVIFFVTKRGVLDDGSAARPTVQIIDPSEAKTK